MQNRHFTAETTEAPATPAVQTPEPAPPNWTAIAALVISILTLAKSLWTDFNSHRSKAEATFESNYGGPVRDGLRTFERRLSSLRVFTLASGKTLPELKAELEPLRGEWEDASIELTNLLEEVDTARAAADGWANRFHGHARKAEQALQTISGPTTTDIAAFMAQAELALGHYKAGIFEVRDLLAQQNPSYNKDRRKHAPA